MKKFLLLIAAGFIASTILFSQTRSIPSGSPVQSTTSPANASRKTTGIPQGTITGNVYTNNFLGFTVPLPDTWTIATDEFVTYMRSKGVDVRAKPPRAADLLSQKKVDDNFKRLSILATAYRSSPGTPQNSMVQIAAEDFRDLNTNRPVKDAVDYVDLMRAQLATVKMPATYTYSETNAEKLGPNQFAYLDTSDSDGKTRIYVTVRKGYAILFSLAYNADDDLETFRDILARANFALK
jgi:hypothetical protein